MRGGARGEIALDAGVFCLLEDRWIGVGGEIDILIQSVCLGRRRLIYSSGVCVSMIERNLCQMNAT